MKKKIILTLTMILFLSFHLLGIDFIARTLKVKGTVNLTRNTQVSPAVIGDNLFNGDELETKNESYAAIKFADKSSIIKLFPNSILNINTEKEKDKTSKKNLLKMGELWAQIDKGTGKFEVETPTTVASVKGTNFLINFTEDGITNLYTFDGEILMQNKIDGETAIIKAGQKGSSTGQGPISIQAFDPDEIIQSTNNFINEEIEPIEIEEPEERESIPPEEIIPPIEKPEEETGAGAGPFNMGGGVGTIMIGDNTYFQLRLLPEICVGKFGLGLNIELLLDNNGKIRKEDWDDWKDYLNKIYYLRYGLRGDPFYGRIGGFPSYTLGHGLIMKDYSNMLRYPDDRQIGLQIGGNLPFADMSVEVFSSDIIDNEILAGRLTIQPLKSTEVPLFSNLTFGGTVAHDRNQIKGLLDTDDDNYPDVFDDFPYNEDWHDQVDYDIDIYHDVYFELNPYATEEEFETWFDTTSVLPRNKHFDDIGKDKVTVVGLDYELPLITKKLFYLSHYGEAAKILDHNMGFIFPGFYSKFLIFDMNLEYRFYQDDFAPAFFGHLYEEERAVVNTISDSVTTKEMTLINYQKSQGWYACITSNLFKFLYLTIAYEDMYGDDYNNRSFWGKVNLDTKLIPKLTKAELSYSQTGFDKLTEFKSPNAIIEGTIGYSLGGSTQLVAKYQERYVDLDGNGKIKGEDETITTMNIGVEFCF
ncbi:MAG: FecR domain-containing protein [Candidatus Cloacimonetes bacterium]|nr:FecR domain-containing protein [Candidatus Cloacimonadota bacterium]